MSGRLTHWWRRLRSLRPVAPGAGISVVMPVAYDWRYALQSLPHCYGIADEVLLGLDAKRISWSGKPYPFDERAFRRGLTRLDALGKVRVVEADFHAQGSPRDNDTYERNLLSRLCKPGNWVLQIDSDEWMTNPLEFKAWLQAQRWEREVQAHWSVVYKVIGATALVIDGPPEWVGVGSTRRGAYVHMRDTGGWPRRSPLHLLHFAWGRSRAELKRKLGNWSHSGDFDAAAALKRWDAVTLRNYRAVRDFHPIHPTVWPSLRAEPLARLRALAGRGA
jgi:hypothetical protein